MADQNDNLEALMQRSLKGDQRAYAAFYFMRHQASTHCAIAGSVALLSAFSVGALWLRLEEVNDSILHVVEWHYLPMLAIGILGLGLGKKILKW